MHNVLRVEVIKTEREIKGQLSFSLEGTWYDLKKKGIIWENYVILQ